MILLMIFCLLCSFTTLNAQYSLNEFTDLISNSDNVYMQFDVSGEALDFSQNNGRLYFTKDMYRMEIGNSIITNNGKEYVNYDKSYNEAVIFPSEQDDANPTEIFLMAQKAETTKISENDDVAIFELIPTDSTMYSKVVLHLNKKNNAPSKMQLTVTGGTELSVTVIDFVVNQQLPENLFTFDEKRYPDVTIVDMR